VPEFAAPLCLKISDLCVSDSQKSEWIDTAVKRAPFLAFVRQARLTLSLKQGKFKRAESDAEHLLGLLHGSSEQTRICLMVGTSFVEEGRWEVAESWFRKALRNCPDDPDVRFALARGLAQTGKTLRAAELLDTTLRILDRKFEEMSSSAHHQPDEFARLVELRSKVHFESAELLRQMGEPASTILAHLAAVGMRTSAGVRARMAEAAIFHEMGNKVAERDQALYRLVEAVEIGWVGSDGVGEELLEFCRARDLWQSEVTAFASRVFPKVVFVP
jgi:tetratricopeptide (TPR) repeat protein